MAADGRGRDVPCAEAAAVYAWADSVPHPANVPGALVRSWAERAAILQQLGRTAEAITLYQRFVDAWQHANPGRQPLVERARRAVEALGGPSRNAAASLPVAAATGARGY